MGKVIKVIVMFLIISTLACNLFAASATTTLSNIVAKGLTINKPNNTAVFKVNTSDTYSGVGAGLTGSPRLFIGTKTSTNDDSAIAIGRNVTGSNLFSHAIRDESTFNSTTDGAYASYDSYATMTGATDPYNHFRSFQSRLQYNGTGQLDTADGYSYTVGGSGHINRAIGFHMYDAETTGTIDELYGLWIPQLTKGTINYAIYSNGDNPSYHGGLWQVGSPGIISAGPVTGSNVKTIDATHTVKLGTSQTTSEISYGTLVGRGAGAVATGGFQTFIGANAGAATVSGEKNTYIGAFAGYSNTGSGNIFIGSQAGYWEADSNLFAISNTNTGTRANYFMFGKMDSTTPANQYLTVNGGLTLGTTTTAPTCDSSRRGQFWYSPGGAGAKDAVQVCAKAADNAYAWRTIY